MPVGSSPGDAQPARTAGSTRALSVRKNSAPSSRAHLVVASLISCRAGPPYLHTGAERVDQLSASPYGSAMADAPSAAMLCHRE